MAYGIAHRIQGLLRRAAREHGQALVLFAVGGAAIIGLAGLSVDVGQIVFTRTDLQKVADAAALAGAQDLPASGTATSSAQSYVTANGGANTTAKIEVSTTFSDDDTITVTARRHVTYTFLKVLGLGGTDVSATATARAARYQGGTGVLPWGFIASNDPTSTLLQNPCYIGTGPDGLPEFRQNMDCELKVGAGSNSGGDFGALALDGPGANRYRNAIINGSTTPIRVGDKLNAETGNMAGPTDQGVSDRLARPAPGGCPGNSRNDVLITSGGETRIRPGCEDSPRIIVIPVVDQIDHHSQSTVLGFAFMYLKGMSADTCDGGNGLLAPGGNGNGNGNGNGGNSCGSEGHSSVIAEFISFTTRLPTGIYEGLDGEGDVAVILQG